MAGIRVTRGLAVAGCEYDAGVRSLLALTLAAIGLLGLTGCGSQGVQVAEDDPLHNGAVLFAERCSGCHTLDAAGAQGTSNRSTRAMGPNLNQRKETYFSTIYAIRNGGFSGAIMPQNIVVGSDAEDVARFVAKYAGKDAGN